LGTNRSFWILDFGFWIADCGFGIADLGLRIWYLKEILDYDEGRTQTEDKAICFKNYSIG